MGKRPSDREMAARVILNRKKDGLSIRKICPFEGRGSDGCYNHDCYKLFGKLQRLRLIINFLACPCEVYSEKKVKEITWKWINEETT